MFWPPFQHFWQKLFAMMIIPLAGKESHLVLSHNSSYLLKRQLSQL